MRTIPLSPIALISACVGLFFYGLYTQRKPQPRDDQKLRQHLSEKQIDKMVADSFPASDPPSTY